MVINYTAPGVTTLRATNSALLSVTFYDGDTVADPGTVTVTITRDDGTALLTGASTSGTGAAARTRTLTGAETASLDLLTAVWSGTVNATAVSITTRYDVVGDHLFSLAEARAFDGGKLADTDAYLDADIQAARERIATWFEQICGVAFFRRYRRVDLDGPGVAPLRWDDRRVAIDGDEDGALLLPDRRVATIRSAAVRARGGQTWTALTADELAACALDPDGGLLYREALGSWPAGRRNIRVAYEHGHDRVPEPIAFAALKVLVNQIIPSSLSDRTIQTSTQFGTIQLATPNPSIYGRWFGLPVVDAILAEFSERVPGLA